jgi:hypothetical protein
MKTLKAIIRLTDNPDVREEFAEELEELCEQYNAKCDIDREYT